MGVSGLSRRARGRRGAVPASERTRRPTDVLAAPVTLDVVAAHWRMALFATQDFLAAARSAGRSLGMSQEELARLARDVVAEGAATQQLLDDVAREERLEL